MEDGPKLLIFFALLGTLCAIAMGIEASMDKTVEPVPQEVKIERQN